MIDLKQEAVALIENIPDERTDVLIKVVKTLRELVDENFQQDEIYSRAEQDLSLMEDIETLTRDDNAEKTIRNA